MTWSTSGERRSSHGATSREEANDLGALVEQRWRILTIWRHRDGRPRVSGTNVFSDGADVGASCGCRGARNLRADPRCALLPLGGVPAGAADARIEAVATLVEGDRLQELLTEAFGERRDHGRRRLGLLVTTSMSLVHVDGEQMRIRSWSPGGATGRWRGP
ncbi:MAG: hypothetical protein R2716_06375 [Microthrixaceae bacterium]